MWTSQVEKIASTYLSWGVAGVTCLVWASGLTDPVNAPKALLLGALSVSMLAILIKFGISQMWQDSKPILVFGAFFALCLFLSSIFSEAPIVQTLYGTYGRNTGVVTYLSLLILFISVSMMRARSSQSRIMFALVISGIINIFYCLWVLAFGDPIPWNNTYKSILGLLGNPNFISSFLGIVLSVSFSHLFTPSLELSKKILHGLIVVASGPLIIVSNSIQGIFVALAGCSVVLFYYLRAKFKNSFLSFGYAIIVLLSAFVAIMGMLQKGPLSFIYKKSVSLRGSYWKTGINMGLDHPFTGVGMDTYGDWYRFSRPPVALIDTPGPTTLSNAAHNVVIDIFASGGFPLLISYVLIIGIGLISMVKVTLKLKNYDPLFVSISVAWIGYQVQSFISINQVGLAVWGWVLTGLLIGFEKSLGQPAINSENGKTKTKRASSRQPQVISPQLLAGAGLVLGIFIATPPVSSDANWFHATQAKDIVSLKKSLESNYFNPLNSPRLANAAVIFQNSNLLDDAKFYAKKGIEFNPNYFESYYVLYGLPNVTESEKQMALENMKRLDPNNPNVLHYR